jgi:CheY-like chemotaxis protein/DNA-directed RNA polymerase specialized sigma24 family protein
MWHLKLPQQGRQAFGQRFAQGIGIGLSYRQNRRIGSGAATTQHRRTWGRRLPAMGSQCHCARRTRETGLAGPNDKAENKGTEKVLPRLAIAACPKFALRDCISITLCCLFNAVWDKRFLIMTIAARIAPHLPFLRRYARALTGTQTAGDAGVAATLEAVIADHSLLDPAVSPRLALYKAFQSHWTPAPRMLPGAGAASAAGVAATRLAAITPLPRQALLLSAMEGFTNEDVAWLLDQSGDEVMDLIAEALATIERETATRVLIIEDEPIIAMDLESIVRDLGHEVSGIASTAHDALAIFNAHPPGLVLADIQLADGSSGVDAVRDILAIRALPVIFITAFPERLLTGAKPEPTFLITKPFRTATVKAAIAQALFFNSTEAPVG